MVKRKLIEVALPLEAISRESAREKSIRHGHPSTLHLWWARRPLAAARAVLWSSLVDDPSSRPDEFPTEEEQKTERKRLFDILERLVVWENSNDPKVLDEARAEIKASCGDELLNVLDPFCGGGSGPLEAQRLGLSAYGGDLNPVSIMITKSMVEIPPRFAGRPPVNPKSRAESGLNTWRGAQGLAEDILYYGEWMRERAWERIGHLYPQVDGKTVIAWLWARTVQSPDPAWKGHIPLVGFWVLRKPTPNKPAILIEPVVDHSNQTISYEVREGGTPRDGTVGKNGGRCVATGATFGLEYVRDQGIRGLMNKVLLAIVAKGSQGRLYLNPTEIPDVPEPTWKPEALIPKQTLGFGVAKYGMASWSDLFMDRQLVALSTFSDLLSSVRKEVEEKARQSGICDDQARLRKGGSGVVAYADAVITYLAFAIDRGASFWSSLSSWSNRGEFIRSPFGFPGLMISWDFVEANPFSSSTGNWLGQVSWIAKAVANFPISNMQIGEVLQRDAVSRLREVSNPIVSTDPP